LAAHYSADLHRKISRVQVSNVSCEQWKEAIESGIDTWKSIPVRPPQQRKRRAAKKRIREDSSSDTDGDEEE
jgi:hypothetical protein